MQYSFGNTGSVQAHFTVNVYLFGPAVQPARRVVQCVRGANPQAYTTNANRWLGGTLLGILNTDSAAHITSKLNNTVISHGLFEIVTNGCLRSRLTMQVDSLFGCTSTGSDVTLDSRGDATVRNSVAHDYAALGVG